MKKFIIIIVLMSSLLNANYVTKDEAIKMLQDVDTNDFPASNEVYISNEIEMLDEECLGYQVFEEYRKILNDKARKDNIVRFWYTSYYEEIEVQIIEIIKKDGNIISFDPEKILQEKDSSFKGKMNIYWKSSRILTTQLPNIEIGDIIYTKKKTIRKKVRMEDKLRGCNKTTYSNLIHKQLPNSKI